MYLDTQEIRLLKVAILVAVVLTCLGGCDAKVGDSIAPTWKEAQRLDIERYSGASLGFYEFRLSDGTLCVGGYKAGVTCNWSKQ